ncbi:MAG TPA: MlaD family protein [Baekduia sp.]|nr:MlaD family protein [Baekduia sp.]
MTDVRRTAVLRVVAIAAIVIALAVALGSVAGGGGYKVTATFRDAGQLVTGGLVQVGGRPVGTIEDIRLSPDGLAEVVLDIDDDDVVPLRRGTRATIRTVGLSGLANRFVDLDPGPQAAQEIEDGGELGLTETRGIVDLDALLSSLDPRTRTRLQSLIRNGGTLADDDGGKRVNRALRYLNPALAQTRALAEELTRDRDAFEMLVAGSARTVGALADRDADLERGLASTATTLRTVAAEQRALAAVLAGAPGASRQIRGSLARVGTTFDAIRPALRDLRRASPSVAALLRRTPPASRALRPVVTDLRGLLPGLDTTLGRLAPLARVAVPAVTSATSAVGEATPVFAGLRPYSLDLVGGLFNGLGGTAGNVYDANGHLGRIAVEAGSGSQNGLASLLGTSFGSLQAETNLLARCPGMAAQPAGDGSNPWVTDEAPCDGQRGRR